MSWRLEVNHVTCYRYNRPVVSSYNEARVTPLTTGGQVVLDARVSVTPPGELFTYWDYWGALVHAFDVHDPHQSLQVRSTAMVETGLPQIYAGDAKPEPSALGWEDLAADELADTYYEYLSTSPLVQPSDLAEVAAGLRQAAATPQEAARAAVEWARSQLDYGAGTTHVGTSALEAWQGGRGVCQDYSHLALAVLRAMGIPGRYVSGYFYPKAEGVIGTTVLGEGHAWVEAWTGEWAAFDPTNLVGVDRRHVIVARGRDYSDVAPLRGIFSGPPGSSSEVTVELTRRA